MFIFKRNNPEIGREGSTKRSLPQENFAKGARPLSAQRLPSAEAGAFAPGQASQAFGLEAIPYPGHDPICPQALVVRSDGARHGIARHNLFLKEE